MRRILFAFGVEREEGMMAVMAAAEVQDGPVAVRERLEAFGVEVLAGAMNRPVQVRNGGLVSAGVDRAGRAQVA